MKFGAHVSIAGSIEKAPQRAHEIGCECFQFFSKSPHGGKSLEITEKIAYNFRKQCEKYNLKNYYIHTPYYINLASANNRIYYGSVSAIKEELIKADLIGARAVVTHLGSAKDLGAKEAEKKLIKGLVKIFSDNTSSSSDFKERKFNAKLLLEITAGAGKIMGDNFEEIAHFIKEAEKVIKKSELGVCFDTAHAFASGYDLRNKKTVKKTFDEFDRIIGIERLGLIHLNDSIAEFNSHKDRHDNIGCGKIGIEGIEAILEDKRLKNLDFILETPNGKEVEDLEILKGMR
ncbi:MAG: deoxyribonuclease IV [Patescibacteria group bacterium]|nr:deoxyribonuclease IV [Patescibacteria group bacterium]